MSAAWRVPLAALLPALLACSERLDIPDVPGDVQWLAWVSDRGAEEGVAATRLVELSERGSVSFFADVGPGEHLVGYGGRSFAEAFERGRQRGLEATPLRSSRRCEARLPEPSWWVAIPDSRSTSAMEPSAAPPLTADWVQEACDTSPEPSYALDIECLQAQCLGPARLSSRCAAELPLDACGLGTLSVALSPFGGPACFVAPEAWACTPQPVKPREAFTSQDCLLPQEGQMLPCRFTAFARTETSPYPLDGAVVERVALLGDPEVDVPNTLASYFHLNPGHLLRGVLWGVVALPDGAIWATRSADPESGKGCGSPSGQRPTELVRVDERRFEVTQTSSAPDCLQSMVVDPLGDGFLGAHSGPDGDWAVSRFDASGRVVATVRLPGSSPRGKVAFAGLAVDASRKLLAAGHSQDEGAVRTGLSWINLETLELVDDFEYDLGFTSRVAPGPDGAVIAGVIQSSDQSGARWFVEFSADGAFRQEEFIRPVARDNVAFLDALYLPALEKSLFSVTRDMASVQIWGASGYERAQFFERVVQPARLLPWSPDPTRASVFGVGRTGDGAFVGLLQVLDGVHGSMLPGGIELGASIPGPVALDAAGRLLVTLPWTGELLRITPPSR